MLRQLLNLIEQEEISQVPELAQRLHTTPALVRAMLDTLERQGRLQKVAPTCGVEGACETCPLNGLCGLQKAPPPLWQRQVE